MFITGILEKFTRQEFGEG